MIVVSAVLFGLLVAQIVVWHADRDVSLVFGLLAAVCGGILLESIW